MACRAGFARPSSSHDRSSDDIKLLLQYAAAHPKAPLNPTPTLNAAAHALCDCVGRALKQNFCTVLPGGGAAAPPAPTPDQCDAKQCTSLLPLHRRPRLLLLLCC